MTEPNNAELSSTDMEWPALPYAEWKSTYKTLHLYTQIVGKIRTSLSSPINHWWHSTLYVTPRGLTTSLIPSPGSQFELRFDFFEHELHLETSEGKKAAISMQSRTVADFYREVMDSLQNAGISDHIWTQPQEMLNPIHFEHDRSHGTYNAEQVEKLFRVLLSSNRIMNDFRSRFIGKCSPVHFFWGSFDLAVSRFSGRRAPQHPGGVPFMADWVTREAYSHEVSSCGFWPGDDDNEAFFYSYIYPEPPGFRQSVMPIPGVVFNMQKKEFTLPYEMVRHASDPNSVLLEFFQATYDAAANAAQWDRESLERKGT